MALRIIWSFPHGNQVRSSDSLCVSEPLLTGHRGQEVPMIIKSVYVENLRCIKY